MKKRDFVLNWFAENGTLSREELEEDTGVNYLELGLIDSFAFLELISTCEEEFGIQFDDDDFQNEDIFTIEGFIGILENK